MKEKKLYKIAFMGDKDHGCDIISTLESWGGSNYFSRIGNNSEYAYFINDLGTIDLIHNSAFLSEEMKNFYFLFWHDYSIECHLKVGESINYGGQDYEVDSIFFDANNRCIVYKLKSFGIGVEYITNNELTPVEEFPTEEENDMKRKLAIRGHATRGHEIIELLKMFGAKNNCGCTGDNLGLCYLIDDEFDICAHYFGYDDYEDGELNIFTLEEFLEKFPFKVGDKVFLYDNITEGCVTGMKWDEDKGTVKYCVYTSAECWCDVKELLKWNAIDLVEKHYGKECEEMLKDITLKHLYKLGMENIKDNFKTEIQTKRDIDKAEFMIKHMILPNKMDDKLEYKIPDGLEFDVVVDGKIILKPIKPKYPTTYVECKEMLGENVYYGYSMFMTLQKLIICRDVYWKIAGEEMGLGKPWKPDWYSIKQPKFGIHTVENQIKYITLHVLKNLILVFPTEEMRDAFYENFKDLIEECKELL